MPSSILTINYAKVQDIQNTKDLLTVISSDLVQRDDLSITPSTLAGYFLYNRDLGIPGNFGLNDKIYLNYPGGFITVDDRLNTKFSDFNIQKNLSVMLSSTFVVGFDMRNINGVNSNRIKRVSGVSNINNLNSKRFDNDALTVGSFKNFWYHKGMIMMWSGTYEDLKTHLPFWRLCAPEDLNTGGDVPVPNLQGRFIMGGSYNNYTSTDNFQPPRSFSTPTRLGSIGGENFVSLNDSKFLPSHKHNYMLQMSGGFVSLFAQRDGEEVGQILQAGSVGLSFVKGGGNVLYGEPNTVIHSGGAETGTTGGTLETWATINSVTRLPFISTYISHQHNNIRVTRPSQGREDRGGSSPHDNRPPFYALAYIIYVGVPR
jgi:hypothetical protein